MENKIKTSCILMAFAVISSGCTTASLTARGEVQSTPPMYLSVAQVPQIGYVYCETDTCPKPTTKTLPVAKSIPTSVLDSPKPQSSSAVGTNRDAVLEISFPFNKATITASDRALLENNFKKISPSAIRIVGRSDFVGPPPAQTKLAIGRAEVIRAALSSISSSPQITVETEVAAPSPVGASLQAHQRRGSVFFVR